MNPLAIELYKMHGKDITTSPLPFNVNNQHMNGGIDVDIWSQTSLYGCYAIGEVAGTHGVTRPGGAALNAGQVFGTRCAKHIAKQKPQQPTMDQLKTLKQEITEVLKQAIGDVNNNKGISLSEVRDDVQARMSDFAGFICHVDDIEKALHESKRLNQKIFEQGLSTPANQMAQYFQWKQTALTSEALLTALQYYAKNGGGSRGARAMCSSHGEVTPEARNVDLSEFKFIQEKDEHKEHKLVLKRSGEDWNIEEVSLRDMESPSKIFFEKNWAPYLTDHIYEDEFKHE
jgi:succinate dehydrogenase/fumarate reductase flavoprotein subunit